VRSLRSYYQYHPEWFRLYDRRSFPDSNSSQIRSISGAKIRHWEGLASIFSELAGCTNPELKTRFGLLLASTQDQDQSDQRILADLH
jgi:hypothetical protein